jgi:hypothetical protein
VTKGMSIPMQTSSAGRLRRYGRRFIRLRRDEAAAGLTAVAVTT